MWVEEGKMHHNVTVSVVSVLRQLQKMSMDMNEKIMV